MSSADERLLKILLQVQSDVSGIAPVKAGLADTQAQVAAITASQQDQLGIMAAATAAEEERAAALAQQAAIESQLQVIAQTRFDLTSARIAGDAAGVKLASNDLAINTATLGIMRSRVLSEAELNALTESEAVLLGKSAVGAEAVAAGGLLAGASLNRARGEAIQFAKEIEEGRIRTQTVGALLGSFGTSLTLAGLAGYGLFTVVRSVYSDFANITDEEKKATDELDNQVAKWTELVKVATSLSDVVKIGEQITGALDAAAAKFDELQKKQLTLRQTLVDSFLTALRTAQDDPLSGAGPPGPEQSALDAQKNAARELLQIRLENDAALQDEAQKTADYFEALKSGAPAQAIDVLKQKVAGLDQQLAVLGAQRTPPLGATDDQLKTAKDAQDAYAKLTAQRAVFIKLLDDEEKAQQKITSEVDRTAVAREKLLDQEAVMNAYAYGSEDDIAKAQWAEKYNQILEQRKKLGLDISAGTINELVYEQLIGAERKKELADASNIRAVQKDVTEFTREQALALQEVRNAQEVIKQNPFLTLDQKDALSIPLIATEIDNLNAEIVKGRGLLSGGTLDPAQYDRVAQEVSNLDTRVKLLQFDLQKLSFGGKLQADLVAWASQFSDASKQVSSVITGTLNTAISGTSQALTGLIFQTTTWQQAFAQAAQSIIQSIVQIALQYVVSKLVMAAIDRLTGTASGNAASQAATSAATAWAPAAELAAIASYGAAVPIGTGAVIAGIAVAEGAAIGASAAGSSSGGGGYRKGGYTGDGSADEIAGPAHKKEFVFTADETAALGVPFLQKLAANAGGVARFHEGGDADIAAAGRLATGGADPRIAYDPQTNSYYNIDPSIEPTPIPNQTPSDAYRFPGTDLIYDPGSGLVYNSRNPGYGPGSDLTGSSDSIGPNVQVSGGNPTVETPTGPGDVPFENIDWNPAPAPAWIGGDTPYGGGDVPPENISWNAPPSPGEISGGHGTEPFYSGYGIVSGLGEPNIGGGEPGGDAIYGQRGRLRSPPGFGAGLTGSFGATDILPKVRHSGGLADDEFFSILQNREFVMPQRSVDHWGVDFMEAIKDMRVPSHHAGGPIGSSAPASIRGNDKIEIHMWADQAEAQKKFLSSPAYRKHIQGLKLR